MARGPKTGHPCGPSRAVGLRLRRSFESSLRSPRAPGASMALARRSLCSLGGRGCLSRQAARPALPPSGLPRPAAPVHGRSGARRRAVHGAPKANQHRRAHCRRCAIARSARPEPAISGSKTRGRLGSSPHGSRGKQKGCRCRASRCVLPTPAPSPLGRGEYRRKNKICTRAGDLKNISAKIMPWTNSQKSNTAANEKERAENRFP